MNLLKRKQANQTQITVEGPRPLRLLWWLFSSNFRTWSSPTRAEARIAAVQAEHQVTRAQALAIVSNEMTNPATREAFRPLLNQYRNAEKAG